MFVPTEVHSSQSGDSTSEINALQLIHILSPYAFFFTSLFRIWNAVFRWLSRNQTHAGCSTNCLANQLQKGLRLVDPRLHGLRWSQRRRQRLVPRGFRGPFGLWIQWEVLPRGCCIVGKRMCFSRKIWRLRKGPLLEAMDWQYNEPILNSSCTYLWDINKRCCATNTLFLFIAELCVRPPRNLL